MKWEGPGVDTPHPTQNCHSHYCCHDPHCDIWDDNGPHRLTPLHMSSRVSKTVWEGLGGVFHLEKVSEGEGLEVSKGSQHPQYPLCGLRCELLGVPAAMQLYHHGL